MGPSRVIVKKGEHGSLMLSADGFFALPAFPLTELVDPTGAGDSFAGGIIGYLAGALVIDDEAFRKALVVGTLVASHTVRDFSLTQLKALTKGQLDTQFEEYRGFVGLPEGL
jgi:cytidine kinase